MLLKKLMNTGDSAALFVLRITLGMVMLMHGLRQSLGLFGGTTVMQRVNYYYDSFQIPKVLGFMGILIVTVGALMLIIGLWGRIMALLIGMFQLAALLLNHIQHGFFMNWTGTQSGEGFEYHILTIGMAVAIIIYGSGKWSLDRHLTRFYRILEWTDTQPHWAERE